jgi:hypothetical protein
LNDKKIIKKMVALILCLAVCFTIFPSAASVRASGDASGQSTAKQEGAKTEEETNQPMESNSEESESDKILNDQEQTDPQVIPGKSQESEINNKDLPPEENQKQSDELKNTAIGKQQDNGGEVSKTDADQSGNNDASLFNAQNGSKSSPVIFTIDNIKQAIADKEGIYTTYEEAKVAKEAVGDMSEPAVDEYVDQNFAQAIKDSIEANPNEFLNGQSLSENDFQDMETLLNSFTGYLQAKSKGIKSIKGISMLKSCRKIDISYNNISDITPLSVTDAVSAEDVPADKRIYYGANNKAISVNLFGNPITDYPAQLGGRISVVPGLENHSFILKSNELSFLVSNMENSFSAVLPIPLKKGEQQATLITGILTDKVIPEYVIEDDPNDDSIDLNEGSAKNTWAKLNGEIFGQIDRINLKNIKTSGSFMVELYVDDIDKLSGYGANTIRNWTQPLNWTLPVNVKVYTEVKADTVDTIHEVSLLKKSELENDSCSTEGARYTLYKENDDGSYKKIAEDLITDANGKITLSSKENAELTAGSYYFEETTPPTGFGKNPAHVEFTLEDGSIEVLDGEGKEISVTQDGGVETKPVTSSNGVFVLSGEGNAASLKITPPISSDGKSGELKSLTLKCSAGTSQEDGKAVAEETVTYEVGKDGTADEVQTVALNRLKEAQKKYQNVEISADFKQTVSVEHMDPPVADLEFTKVTEDGSTTVSGADFTLYECTNKTEGHTHGKGCTWDKPFENRDNVTSGDNGKVSFKDLPVDAYYILRETKTPDAFQEVTDDSYIVLHIASDRSITMDTGVGTFANNMIIKPSGNDGYKVKNFHLYHLTISKTVKGDGANLLKDFHFTITLKDPQGNLVNGKYSYKGSATAETTAPVNGNLTFVDGKADITLRHGQSIQIEDIVAYSEYVVEEQEANSEGYTTTSDNSSKVITSDLTASFTNAKYSNPITGLFDLYSTGISAMLATILVMGAVIFLIHRRRRRY